MNKIAIFGGTFDPIHLGHMSCLKHLTDEMNFSKVFVVPTGMNPLKTRVPTTSSQQRLEMLSMALKDYEEVVTIDESEIHHLEPTFTVTTLEKYRKDYSPEEIYLVLGIDVFNRLDEWKDYQRIFDLANVLVVSRPPHMRPYGIEEFPLGLQSLVHTYDKGFALMNSGRTIEFTSIGSEEISSSEIRKRMKTGKSLTAYLDMDVEKYIIDNEVYPRLEPGKIDFHKLTKYCGEILKQRAMNASGYDLTELDKLYDYTLIASATSTKQSQSIASIIKEEVKNDFGLSPFGEEGQDTGRWVILDYGALIIHIFYDYVRHEYHLEQLWSEGQRIDL